MVGFGRFARWSAAALLVVTGCGGETALSTDAAASDLVSTRDGRGPDAQAVPDTAPAVDAVAYGSASFPDTRPNDAPPPDSAVIDGADEKDAASPGDTRVADTRPAPADVVDLGPAPDMRVDPVNRCSATPMGPAPLRRLTTVEYRNSTRDLLGVSPALAFPVDADLDGFETFADAQAVSPLWIEAYMNGAETLAGAAAMKLPQLLACDLAVSGDDACAARFIESFGLRAYRRPLVADEKARLQQLYAAVKVRTGFAGAIEATLGAMLQTPWFLYRPELGTAARTSDRVRLSGYEIATRLSYLVWASTPDSALLAAAAAGKLALTSEMTAEAQRLLADPRAKTGVREFARQWLRLDRVLTITKDPKLFPSFNRDTVAPAMREEPLRFFEAIALERSEGVSALLTSPWTFANIDLSRLYGIVPPPSDWARVELDPTRRRGLLTQPWFLATHATDTRTSPTYRGAFVRERIQCQPIPPPPPNLNTSLATDPTRTTRELVSQHQQDPACAGCHRLMDPVGFAFEHYDALGAFRATQNGKLIDSSGELVGSDVDGTFANALALTNRLAASAQVSACVERRWYEHAHGRPRVEADDCRLAEVANARGSLRDIVLAIVGRDDFAARPVAGLAAAAPMTSALVSEDPAVARSVRKLVIDLLVAEYQRLAAAVTMQDRQRMDVHLTALRDLERKLSR